MEELSTADSEPSADSNKTAATSSILGLPEEVVLKILALLDPFDVWSVARTCKLFAQLTDNELLWRHQWTKLSAKTPFRFPPSHNLQALGLRYRDCCRRLCGSLVCGVEGAAPFQKCRHCGEYTCIQTCLEKRSAAKIVIDIGGKRTWLMTANYNLKQHLSMIAVPKLLRCYDCDSTLERGKSTCDCTEDQQQRSQLPSWAAPNCRYESVSSHTGLQYCSQQLNRLLYQEYHDQPLCLFCEEDRVNRLLCEKDMVLRTKNRLAALGQPYSMEEAAANSQQLKSGYTFLSNGYCQDASFILGTENIDLLSPLIALEHVEAFVLVKSFLGHLFKTFKLIDDLQRPNACLIFTEPSNFPFPVREKLLRYLFEDIQISRLCFLPKALAISLLFEVDTCIVIDSGATSTTVWVVMEGVVDTSRTRSIGIGGWHVSEFLQQFLAWRGGGAGAGEETDVGAAAATPLAAAATISSLDTTDVKQKCRLSLNLSREEARMSPRTETLHIRTQRGEGGGSRLRGGGGGGSNHYATQSGGSSRADMWEVTLSSELYLAPEMMYVSLDLPNMIVEATRDLPQEYVKDCFSHILLTGGNTDLQGFIPRLSSDLRDRLPEQAALINISPFPTVGGNHSWDTAMGAHLVKVPQPDPDGLQLHTPGTPFWISREEYILFGAHQLTDLGPGGDAASEMG